MSKIYISCLKCYQPLTSVEKLSKDQQFYIMNSVINVEEETSKNSLQQNIRKLKCKCCWERIAIKNRKQSFVRVYCEKVRIEQIRYKLNPDYSSDQDQNTIYQNNNDNPVSRMNKFATKVLEQEYNKLESQLETIKNQDIEGTLNYFTKALQQLKKQDIVAKIIERQNRQREEMDTDRD